MGPVVHFDETLAEIIRLGTETRKCRQRFVLEFQCRFPRAVKTVDTYRGQLAFLGVLALGLAELRVRRHVKDVIGLTVGQPDFLTPWHIRVAGIESLETGKCFYTANSGTPALREEIAGYLARRFSLTYDPVDEIIVTVGGSEAIDLAIRALVCPGDEVIIPQPAFVCYGPLVSLAGGVPVYINTKEENAFKLTADELKAALSPKTKLVVLPYPNNPTGAVMTKEDKVKAIRFLNNSGAFLITKSGDRVTEAFGISKFTLYSYLDAAKES